MIKSIFIIIISFLFLLNCHSKRQSNSNEESPAPQESPTEPDTPAPSALQEKAAFTLPSCSGNDCCASEEGCIKQCDGIFTEADEKQKCLALPIQMVGDMDQTLNEYLKTPDWESLNKVKPFPLWAVIKISEKPWLKKINSYSKPQVKNTLLWLASKPFVSELVFAPFSRKESVRRLLIALFRKNALSSLMDDNVILSGLKADLSEEEGEHFFKMVEKNNNRSLLSLVNKEVVESHVCDYSINQPLPVYTSDKSYSACILAVYCYVTGSYTEGQYVSDQAEDRGQGENLRRWLAGELNHQKVNDFVQKSESKGGLEVSESPDKWPDPACQKLQTLWEDGNIKFGL